MRSLRKTPTPPMARARLARALSGVRQAKARRRTRGLRRRRRCMTTPSCSSTRPTTMRWAQPRRRGWFDLLRRTGKLQSIGADQLGLPERPAAIDHSDAVPHTATQDTTQVVLFGRLQRNGLVVRLNSFQTLGRHQQPPQLSHLTGRGCRGGPPPASPH